MNMYTTNNTVLTFTGNTVLTLSLICCAAGCDPYWGPFPVGISPVVIAEVSSDAAIGPPEAETWREEVRGAIVTWNVLLDNEAPGCAPFYLTDDGDGYPVEKVPLSKWTFSPRTLGLTYDDHIEIRGDLAPSPRYYVLIHELGHAMGLDDNDDPNSVMYQYLNDAKPTPEDVRSALAKMNDRNRAAGGADCGQ